MGYRNVYFRIDSQYVHDKGWTSNDLKCAFREETHRLFQNDGWTVQPGTISGACDTVVKGQQDLYLHPMNFSGVILEDDIPHLEALFAQAKTFRCYHVDCYKEYLDLCDEDYWVLLESRRAEITAEILRYCTTKRRNLFVTDPVALAVAKKFAVCRLCDKENTGTVINCFVSQLVGELVTDGQLIASKTTYGEGLRAATAGELQCLPIRKNLSGQLAM